MTQAPRKRKNRLARLAKVYLRTISFFKTSSFWQEVGARLSGTYNDSKNWQWSAILLSLSTALVFWIFHQLNQDHSTNLAYPVKFEAQHDSLVTVKPPPSTVLLNVTGYGWVLLAKSWGLGNDEITVTLNNPITTKHLSGERIKALATAQLHTDVIINQSVEDSILFDFDTLSRKKVFVSLERDQVDLASRYWIASTIETQPHYVWVTGPSKMLATFRDTLPLIFDQKTPLDHPFSSNLKVAMPSDKFLKLEQSEVHVSFDVSAYKEEESYARVELKNFPKDVELSVRPTHGMFKYYVGLDTELDFKDTLSIVLDYHAMLPDSTIIPSEGDSIHLLNYSIIPKTFKVEKTK